MNTKEQSLIKKLKSTDSNVLDVNIPPEKCIYTVTVEGHDVQDDVLRTCREFGYKKILKINNITWTYEIDKATTIIFHY